MMEAAGEDNAAVPATLKDSLMARLDRLGEAREVAHHRLARGPPARLFASQSVAKLINDLRIAANVPA